MFTVFLTNFGYALQGEWALESDAIAAARKAGFEATLLCKGRVVASWSPLSGYRVIGGVL